MQFSQILAKLMDENGLTNYQLAKDLDVHPSTVANWLDGKTPRKKTLLQISRYFNVSTEFLLGSEQKENAPAQKGEHVVTDEDIKFALWGDSSNIDDEDLADVKRYAAFVAERKKRSKE